MKRRELIFILAAAFIGITSTIISSFTLSGIQGKESRIDKRIQRLDQLQRNIIETESKAYQALNFSDVHLNLSHLHPDDGGKALLSSAGSNYFESLKFEAVSTYDEGNADGLTELSMLIDELERYKPLFETDLGLALDSTEYVRKNIHRIAAKRTLDNVNERQNLTQQRSELSQKESNVRFMATSLQFLSILLVLVRDLFKSKKPVA